MTTRATCSASDLPARFVGDRFKPGNDDHPEFGQDIAHGAGNVRGGHVVVVVAFVVPALLDVADSPADHGELGADFEGNRA